MEFPEVPDLEEVLREVADLEARKNMQTQRIKSDSDLSNEVQQLRAKVREYESQFQQLKDRAKVEDWVEMNCPVLLQASPEKDPEYAGSLGVISVNGSTKNVSCPALSSYSTWFGLSRKYYCSISCNSCQILESIQ